jgi:uncharacterized protein (DUF2062 family)
MLYDVTKRETIREALRQTWQRLRGGELSPERAAASVAVGFFVGCVPFYGIQTFICLLFTVPLRLDFPVAWMVTNFANPFTAPFLILLEIELGAWMVQGQWVSVSVQDLNVKRLGDFLGYALVGGGLIGTVTAGIAGGLTLWWMRRSARARAAAAHSAIRTPST